MQLLLTAQLAAAAPAAAPAPSVRQLLTRAALPRRQLLTRGPLPTCPAGPSPQVRAAPLKAGFVFIAPPSLEELEHRLRGRATGAWQRVAACSRLPCHAMLSPVFQQRGGPAAGAAAPAAMPPPAAP